MRRRLIPILLLSCLLAALCLPVGAVPIEKPECIYVADYANVLSDDVEQHIIERNQDIYRRTGGQIVVVTVNVIDRRFIYDYAYELFDEWGIGDSQRNNGVLLLACASQRTCIALQGSGISNDLSTELLHGMVIDYLVPGVSVGDYNSGMLACFDAVADWFDEFYEGTSYVPAINSPSDLRGAPRPRGLDDLQPGLASQRTGLLIALLAVLCLLPLVLDYFRYRAWRRQCADRRALGQAPPPYRPFIFGHRKPDA